MQKHARGLCVPDLSLPAGGGWIWQTHNNQQRCHIEDLQISNCILALILKWFYGFIPPPMGVAECGVGVWMNHREGWCIVFPFSFTAQAAAPWRNLTLPACKLLNLAGICVASRGFVSVVFDWPMWICFHGFWFPRVTLPLWIPTGVVFFFCQLVSAVFNNITWIHKSLSMNCGSIVNDGDSLFCRWPKIDLDLWVYYICIKY